jgi:hypothetical protein
MYFGVLHMRQFVEEVSQVLQELSQGRQELPDMYEPSGQVVSVVHSPLTNSFAATHVRQSILDPAEQVTQEASHAAHSVELSFVETIIASTYS